MNTAHLTDEQFSDVLAGENAPVAAMLHLEACEHCRHELGEIRSAVGSFSQMSWDWAQAEAPRRIQPPSRWKVRSGALPAWSLAAASAMLIVAFGVHREMTGDAATQNQSVAAVETLSVHVPSSNELAEDNRLMMSINQELSYQARPSVPLAELQAKGSVRAHRVTN